MHARFAVFAALAAGALSGRAVLTALTAGERCAGLAAEYGDGRVVGVFVTDAGGLRSFSARSELDGLAADTPAVLCWIDAEIAKAPPPDPQGEAPDNFDRAAIALVEDLHVFLVAGYRDRLEVTRP